ncbi:retinol dehydrogenase 14-like isoform X1 [Clavelina lepadiformis]|uniref:retinol dehydrogenase 14-like isoform X1 n=1 Tax=Clavelina lepadiformis TaxID=159417 RepID=UPI004042D545
MAEEQQRTASGGWVRSDVRMDGKTVVITGADQGIGFETALDLARRGARVIMGSRKTDDGEKAKAKILKECPDANVVAIKLNLASFVSIHVFARRINDNEPRLDVLINNAAITGCPKSTTVEGFDMQMGVNHIGHFLLIELLINLLKTSAPSRIIIVSSSVHKLGEMKWADMMHNVNYSPLPMYFQTKLANVYFCLELSRRLRGSEVTCNCLNPGLVRGEGYSCPFKCFFTCCCCCLDRAVHISPQEGAQTSLYCAIAPELQEVSGKYFNKCAEERLSNRASNAEAAKQLWLMTEEWIDDILRDSPPLSPSEQIPVLRESP